MTTIDNLKNNLIDKILSVSNEKFLLAIDNFSKGLKVKNLLQLQPVVYSALLDNLAYSKFKLNNSQILSCFLSI